jgi:hypothetical protein
VNSSLIAPQRTRLSVRLAVGGTVALMAGACMMLAGEAMKLSGPSGWPHLVIPGLALALSGMALGVACAVVTMSGRRERARSGQAMLSSRVAGRVMPSPDAGRAPDDWATGRSGSDYADDGWQLDGPGPAAGRFAADQAGSRHFARKDSAS